MSHGTRETDQHHNRSRPGTPLARCAAVEDFLFLSRRPRNLRISLPAEGRVSTLSTPFGPSREARRTCEDGRQVNPKHAQASVLEIQAPP